MISSPCIKETPATFTTPSPEPGVSPQPCCTTWHLRLSQFNPFLRSGGMRSRPELRQSRCSHTPALFAPMPEH